MVSAHTRYVKTATRANVSIFAEPALMS